MVFLLLKSYCSAGNVAMALTHPWPLSRGESTRLRRVGKYWSSTSGELLVFDEKKNIDFNVGKPLVFDKVKSA